MKYNRFGEEVEDNDPEGIYDEKPENPEVRPTNPPPANAPDASVLAAYQQQLVAESQRRRALEEENARLKQTPAPKAPTPEEERQFFDNPKTSTRDIVREEVAAAVAPLNEFTKGMARQSTYADLKRQMKESGKYPYLSTIESLFDQAMNGIEPTVQSMINGYTQAVGFYVTNGGTFDQAPRNDAPRNDAPATPPAKPLPPHARPTPPSSRPTNNMNKTQVRELNANEKVIMRHNGWTDPKEYLFWTEHVDAKEVGHLTPEQVKARIKEIFG